MATLHLFYVLHISYGKQIINRSTGNYARCFVPAARLPSNFKCVENPRTLYSLNDAYIYIYLAVYMYKLLFYIKHDAHFSHCTCCAIYSMNDIVFNICAFICSHLFISMEIVCVQFVRWARGGWGREGLNEHVSLCYTPPPTPMSSIQSPNMCAQSARLFDTRKQYPTQIAQGRNLLYVHSSTSVLLH